MGAHLAEIPYRQVEGSLAFVDISGFTALTERLARRGKVGAELLRDTLDGVFNALLDEAYQWGAGLIKWGGDALLLLFDGPGHEARAARSAWEMQRTIERVGRLRVGGGTVTLRMSIGITSGPIDFFTAGSVHRELLVVGPTATETAEIEAVAEAGEIGISQALARHLDPSCVGPPRRAPACSSRRRKPIGSGRPTLAPSAASTWRRASRSPRAPTCCSSGASPSTARSPQPSSISWTRTSCSSGSGRPGSRRRSSSASA